jgi:CRP-like cAMP-binding protein
MNRSQRRTVLDELTGYAAFADCSPAALAALAKASDHFVLRSNWSLMQQGIAADALYVVREGEAHVYQGRTRIATLYPGDVFGETALFGTGQRTATVTSPGHLVALRIGYRKLARLVRRYPEIGQAIEAVHHSRTGEPVGV